MLQLSNSQKFAGNTWHLPWKKSVIRESENNIRIIDLQAMMTETLSVLFARHVVHADNCVLP